MASPTAGSNAPSWICSADHCRAAASPVLRGQFAADLSIVLGYLLQFRHETPTESQQADLVVESERPHIHVARADHTRLVVNGEEFRVKDGRRRIPEDPDPRLQQRAVIGPLSV